MARRKGHKLMIKGSAVGGKHKGRKRGGRKGRRKGGRKRR